MGDIGDLTDFLKEGNVANLDWLDVDAETARATAVLPKQNLDVVPELEAQWSHEDKDPRAYFVPNRDMAGYPVDPKFPVPPNTMGDMSQEHGPLRTAPESLMRMARLTLVQSPSVQNLQAKLTAKYSRDELRTYKTALAGVLAERGLLGGLYINAVDFPTCATSKASSDFVRKYASGARYVVAKAACSDCVHSSGTRCSMFHKELVPEIQYTKELAEQVVASQKTLGKMASTGGDPKARIQSALLGTLVTPRTAAFSGQSNTGAVIPAERLLRKGTDVRAQEEQLKQAKARPIVEMVRRELLKGRTAGEIAKGLRLAFDPRDLKATDQYWLPLYKEAGLYGTVYSTQDSFSDCRVGADFLSKHSSKVRGIVAGSKCSSCIFNKVGRCMMYGRKLVASAEDLYTSETVTAVLDEHKLAGTLSPVTASQPWPLEPKAALQAIAKTAAKTPKGGVERISQPRLGAQQGFYGRETGSGTGGLTVREVVKTAREFLNEGLYGADLKRALQSRFDPRDIVAAAPELRKVVAEQGLQGIYYVDPTVYADYGKGCKTAERKHRSRAAIKYAKVGDKCGSCVHQNMPGVCSVLKKQLVVEPPYQNKVAQQKAVLASGEAMTIDVATLVSAGPSIVQEFEITGGTGSFDLNPEAESVETSIEFGPNSLDVSKL